MAAMWVMGVPSTYMQSAPAPSACASSCPIREGPMMALIGLDVQVKRIGRSGRQTRSNRTMGTFRSSNSRGNFSLPIHIIPLCRVFSSPSRHAPCLQTFEQTSGREIARKIAPTKVPIGLGAYRGGGMEKLRDSNDRMGESFKIPTRYPAPG